MLNVQAFMDSLPIMGMGMVGIFIVTIIIIAVVSFLNRFTAWLENKKNKQ